LTRARLPTGRHGSPRQYPIAFLIKEGEPYQLIALVHVHDSAQILDNLYPALGDVLSRDVITDFELHERLA